MHHVRSTVGRHDQPIHPVSHRDDLRATLTRPWPGSRSACWLCLDGGHPIGYGWLSLPGGANAGLANVQVDVLPDHRRRRVGWGLVREAVRLAYSAGRTAILAQVAVDSPGGRPSPGPWAPYRCSATSAPSCLSGRRIRVPCRPATS